jgi:hypothetical protein
MNRPRVPAAVLAVIGVIALWPWIGPVVAAEPGAAEPGAAEPGTAEPSAPAKPAETPAEASPQEVAARKVEKLLTSIRDKMSDFQKEEFQIEMATIKSTGAALQAVKNPKKATEQLAKNAVTPDLAAYRNAVLAAARQWLDYQQRYAGIGRTIKTLEREKPNVPAGLQEDIAALTAKFEQKNRSLQLKIVELYDTAGDYRGALAACSAIYRAIPEEERAGAADLAVLIGDLCAKTGDNAGALAAYKTVLAAKPEADRYKDAKLCEKMGDAYKAAGDAKNALDMYKRAMAATGAAKAAKGGKPPKAVSDLQKKIDDLEKKVAPPAPAKAPAK